MRDEGTLAVVGITQEQHADRCLLFARWKGLDWPILWDPFNMTGSKAVPRVTLIDEHGIVRSTRGSLATFEEDFIAKTFPAPKTAVPAPGGAANELVEVAASKPGSAARSYHEALSALLWPAGRDGEKAMHALQGHAEKHPDDAAAQWRLGVAYRMRHDSLERSLGDFQLAIDQWRLGLELDPSHYIYRRRIEQYGPLHGKPYPFYPWIEEARKELGSRAPPLLAEPCGTETASPRAADAPSAAAKKPDTTGADASIKDGLRMEATVVWGADREGRMGARVHLHVRPAGNRVLLWDAKAGPVTLWFETSAGTVGETGLLVRRLKGVDRAEETVEFDFDVHPDSGKLEPFEIKGFVLYHARLSPGDPAKRLRQDVAIAVRAPTGR